MSSARETFRSVINRYLASGGYEPLRSPGDSVSFRHNRQTVEISLIPDTTRVLFSSPVRRGGAVVFPVDARIVAEFNARWLFTGGACLVVDPGEGSTRIAVGRELSRLRADRLQNDLADFLALARSAAEDLIRQIDCTGSSQD